MKCRHWGSIYRLLQKLPPFSGLGCLVVENLPSVNRYSAVVANKIKKEVLE